MIEKDIIKEFKKYGIKIYRLDKITNSYSSNVYVAYSKDNKYIFKILYNLEKQKGEAYYIEYLSNKIAVPELIFSGSIKDSYYNVISFIEGKSYKDSEIKQLTDEQVYKIGVLLGELHNVKPTDKNPDSWINYLHRYVNKAYKNLKDKIENNKEIYEFIMNSIKSIEGTYENVILHLDYRIGNIIFGEDKEYLIDFESMKNGDPAFDFLKINRLLSKKKFEIFLKGYKSIKKVDDTMIERIRFYNIFDAYTSINWCLERNKFDSDFSKKSMKILEKELKK